MKIVLLLLLLLISISGCASGPRHTDYTAHDASCIEGDLANVFSFFASGEAHVAIMEIDRNLAGGGGRFCVSPGKHQLGIHANNNNQIAQDYIDIEFVPSRNYKLRANLHGMSFLFQLLDITDKPEVLLSEFKLKVGSSSAPITVPVFIPTK